MKNKNVLFVWITKQPLYYYHAVINNFVKSAFCNKKERLHIIVSKKNKIVVWFVEVYILTIMKLLNPNERWFLIDS